MKAKDMPVTALAGWFGAKVGMAEKIVEWLGPHDVYVEPFCGAMFVLMVKSPCRNEIVNDMHNDIINLAFVVQHDKWGPWLYRKLRRCIYSEKLFAYARVAINGYEIAGTPADIDAVLAYRAYYYFLLCWMGRKGIEGVANNSRSFSIRYSASGGNQSSRSQAAIISISAWRKRMRSVTLLCRDGFEILKRLNDDPAQSVYCDPPYLEKAKRYVHDFNKADHRRLAQYLSRFKKSRVVVSYYDHPALADLYPEADWLKVDCRRDKQILTSCDGDKDSSQQAPEVLLVNRSSLK